MNGRLPRAWLFGSATALRVMFLVSASAGSVGANYDLPGMNFDLWCQEQALLPAYRCDERLPGDEKTFEAFRDKVDRYEIPYLRERQRELSVHRDIMENDPVDNPTGACAETCNRKLGAPAP